MTGRDSDRRGRMTRVGKAQWSAVERPDGRGREDAVERCQASGSPCRGTCRETPSATHRRLLTEGVDADATVDVDSPDELACWLVHWGVERLAGETTPTEDGVSLRVPRHGNPSA